MRIFPVLDLLNGEVVRGVGGKRSEYRPMISRLTSSCQPIDIARALRQSFDLEMLYVADLDGIMHRKPNLSVYTQLIADGFGLTVDFGIIDTNDVALAASVGITKVVVGLETCRSPAELEQITELAPAATFSLDLFQGKPRLAENAFGWSRQPFEIVHQIIAAGVTSILVLDLADVGMGTGGQTDELCRFIKTTYPQIQLIAGGGIRGPADLDRLRNNGVDAALVASAVHDGKLNKSDLKRFTDS